MANVTAPVKVNDKSEPKVTEVGTKRKYKGAPKRPVHPDLVDEKVRVKHEPENYDYEKYVGIKRMQFQHDYEFFEYKSREATHKSALFLKRAEDSKKLGSGKERQKATRLVKMQSKMAELMEDLKNSGINVDELLATK